MARTVLLGMATFERRLKALDAAVSGRKLGNAALVAARPITNEWKALMSVPPTTIKTGQYRRSVHQRLLESRPDLAVVAIGTDIDNPPYPKFLEFGTSRMAPRPKARPAFDNKHGEAQREFSRALRDQIEGAIR